MCATDPFLKSDSKPKRKAPWWLVVLGVILAPVILVVLLLPLVLFVISTISIHIIILGLVVPAGADWPVGACSADTFLCLILRRDQQAQ